MKILGDLELNANNAKIASSEIAFIDDNAYQTVADKLTKMTDTLVDYTFEDSSTTEISFDVDIQPGEVCEVFIEGAVTTGCDAYMRINGITSNYYQAGWYDSGTSSSISRITGYRVSSGFYYSHYLRTWGTMLKSLLSVYTDSNGNNYAKYDWEVGCGINSTNTGVGSCGGYVGTAIDSITSISFTANYAFEAGTRIRIKKVVSL